MVEININTEFIKLDQFLKWCGAAGTGGAAKEMIARGMVMVNNEAAVQSGKKLYKGDRIFVEGEGEYIIV
jgi:ribosome-associated protein